MRLIDADVLRKDFSEWRDALAEHYEHGEYLVEEALQSLDEQPTIDAVPVVRCKDCEYSYDISGRWRCSHGICCGRAVSKDFYCKHGERRNE